MTIDYNEIERKMISEGMKASEITQSILRNKESIDFSDIEKRNIDNLIQRIGKNSEWSVRLLFLQKSYLDKLDEKLIILNYINYSINQYNQSSKNDRFCRIIIIIILLYIAYKVS